MTKIQLINIQMHLLFSVMLLGGYIVFLVISKDELEERAQSYALKASNLLTMVSFIFYILYKSVVGDIEFTLHTALAFINILCLLYLLFNFLYLRGIVISFKINNRRVLDIICFISTAGSAVLILTEALKVKIFEISSSFIRLDTLLMMINLIIVSLMIGLYPRKKLSRQEFKEAEVSVKKISKIFFVGYGSFLVCMFGYIIYRFYVR